MRDLNISDTNEELQDFLEEQDLSNLVHFPTCSKNLKNPSTIDNIAVVSTGLSDFHKMVTTSMKTTFRKCLLKVITYRDMKSFDKLTSRRHLEDKLPKH